MTETEIKSLRPGDSIMGAWDEWNDELPVEEVLHTALGTQVLLRCSSALKRCYTLHANGPEIRSVRA